MRGAFNLAVLVCVVYYVFSFSIYRVRCATNGAASSGESDSSTCCCTRSAGRRRGGSGVLRRICPCIRAAPEGAQHVGRGRGIRGFLRRICPCIRPAPEGTQHVEPAPFPPARTAAHLSILTLVRRRTEHTPSCNFVQHNLLPEDYSPSLQSWLSASPYSKRTRYRVVYPSNILGRATKLSHHRHVISHRKCAILEVSKEQTPGFSSETGKWHLEIYPSTCDSKMRLGISSQILKSRLVEIIDGVLRFYGETSATSLREQLSVVLPVAVLERNAPVWHDGRHSLLLLGVSLLRWRVVADLKQFVQKLYESGEIHPDVSDHGVLAALQFITKQLVTLTATLHRRGYVVGDVVPEIFVVGEDGYIYLDGLKHLEQAKDQSMPAGDEREPHTPPELMIWAGAPYTPETDSWELGYLLLKLWCGGFTPRNQSVENMDRGILDTLLSYYEVRAGIAGEVLYDGCLREMPVYVKGIISGFLKREHRMTLSETLRTPDFSALVEAID